MLCPRDCIPSRVVDCATLYISTISQPKRHTIRAVSPHTVQKAIMITTHSFLAQMKICSFLSTFTHLAHHNVKAVRHMNHVAGKTGCYTQLNRPYPFFGPYDKTFIVILQLTATRLEVEIWCQNAAEAQERRAVKHMIRCEMTWCLVQIFEESRTRYKESPWNTIWSSAGMNRGVANFANG